ncbi:MAG TPA: glycosyltransferase family 4 protein [Candidatus Dormibacteraeota bacterium]|nr:glycosyltransferase family 4 protein [Candidatus Dormibacteraeota bacterium]
MDHPHDGELVARDRISVDGWAEYRGRPATEIQVLVDEKVVIVAHPEVLRPDVVRALGLHDASQPYGWAVTLDLSAHPHATACVTVRARLPNGPWWQAGRVTVRSLDPPGAHASGAGSLDRPWADELILGEVVVVRGWAMFGSELPAWIDIEVDGIPVGRARAQLPRADVANAISTPSALASGFEYDVVVPLDPGDSRTLTLTVTAHHDSGSTWSSAAHQVVVTARAYHPESVERARLIRASTINELRPIPDRDPPAVLVFTHSLAVGGGQLFLSELLKRLQQRHGITCSVVSPTDGVLRPLLEGWGIPVHIVEGFPVGSVDAYEAGVRQLALLAHDVGARVALVNTLGVFPAADAAQLAGMEVIWTIHESFELADFSFLNWGPAGLDPVIRDRWTATMRNVSAAVFECDATSHLLAPYIPDERRLVIPYGIPIEEIVAARKRLDRDKLRRAFGILPQELMLLAMAIYEPRKGQTSLIEAFARVALAHPEVVLVLVGDHRSPYASDVERLIMVHDLQTKVIRVPIAADVYDWYAAADVLVSASDVESVPRSMLEAMAFGLPVLAADAYGVPELIRHGRTGWTFPTRDLSGLMAALERVVTALPEERERIAQAARDGCAFFEADLYAADYAGLIHALATGPRAAVRDLVTQRDWCGGLGQTAQGGAGG